MKRRYLRTFLLLLGIAGIVVYFFIPKEIEVECLEKNSDVNPYGNPLLIETEPLAFKCNLPNENENCGIRLSFDSKNWNLMDSLVLEFESSQNFKELVVQILTFDPDHSNENDLSTMKPFIKELELSPDKKRYSIFMDHFYVPDYWFIQQNAKNSHNPKRFYAITGIDIFSAWKNPANTELELKIGNVCAMGVSNTPFVILIIYIGILIAIAISVRTGNS